MPTFLLRLEAVNFGASCYDTNDLSTIRGGSMMLSNAHELIRPKLPAELSGEPISHGASHAIWEFTANDRPQAEQIRIATLQALADDNLLRHATFVCAVAPWNDGTAEEIQHLRMLNRWSQFQQPTIAVPDESTSSLGQQLSYCEFDFVRPGVETEKKGDNSYRLSASTMARRKHGKAKKQQFYRGLLPKDVAAANDLEGLTTFALHPLSGKMAVIYIDGNKQSEMAAQFGLTDLSQFRTYVKEKHREFLASLLTDVVADRREAEKDSEWYFWNKDDQRHQIRLETLLWGGDDILLVVPAWKGWSVVQKFYEWAQTWEFQGEKFTHATGMVFCGEKTPIRGIVDFANQLVIQSKKQSRSRDYRDLIAYDVLESFDIPHANLDQWWAAKIRQRSVEAGDQDAEITGKLLLTPEQMAHIAALVTAAHVEVSKPDSTLSRRQIETLARQMSRRSLVDVELNNEIEKLLNNLREKMLKEHRLVEPVSIRSILFHLTTLWDYI